MFAYISNHKLLDVIPLDNIAHFYNIDFTEAEKSILNAVLDANLFPEHVRPYIRKSTESFLKKFETKDTFKGITITSSGFYAPQGRELRIPTKTKNLHRKLERFSYENNKFLNFEMEAKQNLNNTLMKFFLIQTRDIDDSKNVMKFLKNK